MMHAQFRSRKYSLTYYLLKRMFYLLAHFKERTTNHEDRIIMSLCCCGIFWGTLGKSSFAVENKPIIFNDSVGVKKRAFWWFFLNKMNVIMGGILKGCKKRILKNKQTLSILKMFRITCQRVTKLLYFKSLV
jgi:hypothetical protein